MGKQLDSFKTSLEDFAGKYKQEIKKNPEFRGHFQQMCARIGVDPLACKLYVWPLWPGSLKKIFLTSGKREFCWSFIPFCRHLFLILCLISFASHWVNPSRLLYTCLRVGETKTKYSHLHVSGISIINTQNNWGLQGRKPHREQVGKTSYF